MSDAIKSQEIANEKKGWKGLFIAAVLSVFFLGIFYMAMSNEPDYMPSKQNQTQPNNQASTEHHHNGKAMSDEEMKQMNHTESSSEHAH